jgi:hypothetical protein
LNVAPVKSGVAAAAGAICAKIFEKSNGCCKTPL